MKKITVNSIVMYVNHMDGRAEKATITAIRDQENGVVDLVVFPTSNEKNTVNHVMKKYSEEKNLDTWHWPDQK